MEQGTDLRMWRHDESSREARVLGGTTTACTFGRRVAFLLIRSSWTSFLALFFNGTRRRRRLLLLILLTTIIIVVVIIRTFFVQGLEYGFGGRRSHSSTSWSTGFRKSSNRSSRRRHRAGRSRRRCRCRRRRQEGIIHGLDGVVKFGVFHLLLRFPRNVFRNFDQAGKYGATGRTATFPGGIKF